MLVLAGKWKKTLNKHYGRFWRRTQVSRQLVGGIHSLIVIRYRQGMDLSAGA
ncbi:MAG: hypothetical protein K8R46_08805 [Pirellulales bacterium]|nr:hypothetical protein [Pirellulales bacterium]